MRTRILLILLLFAGVVARGQHTVPHSLIFGYNQVSGISEEFLFPALGPDEASDERLIWFELDMGDVYTSWGSSFTYSVDLKVTTYAFGTSGFEVMDEYLLPSFTISDESTSSEGVRSVYVKDFLPDQNGDWDFSKIGVSVESINSTIPVSLQSLLRFKIKVEESIRYNANGVMVSGLSSECYGLDGFTVDPSLEECHGVHLSWGPSPTSYNYPYYEVQICKSETRNGVAFLAEENALSLVVNGQQDYRLSLVSGSGDYYWRVRPIGDYYPGGLSNRRNYGLWNTEFTIADALNFEYHQFDEHLNWIYKRILTENNKAHESMSYFTSDNAVVQSQTKLSSIEEILTQQTAYDYSGDPSLVSLPAPNGSKNLKFDWDFFLNSSSRLFSAGDFDVSSGSSATLYNPTSINVNSDLYEYYGGYDQGNLHDNYIPLAYNENNGSSTPNADSRPYSRQIIMKDGTGRILRETLPGEELWYGDTETDHSIRYEYYDPSQSELDYLFGVEAPLYNKVKCVRKYDANKTKSLQYVDMQGRILATVMDDRSESPADSPLQMLGGDQETLSVSHEMPDGTFTDNLYYREMELSISPLNSTEASGGKPVTINYDFSPEDYQFCSGVGICDYHVEISLRSVMYPYDVNRNLIIEFDINSQTPPADYDGDIFTDDIVKTYSYIDLELGEEVKHSSIEPQSAFFTGLVTDNEVNLLPGAYVLSKRITSGTDESNVQFHLDALYEDYIAFSPTFEDCLEDDFPEIEYPYYDCDGAVPTCEDLNSELVYFYNTVHSIESDVDYLDFLALDADDLRSQQGEQSFLASIGDLCLLGNDDLNVVYGCLFASLAAVETNYSNFQAYQQGEAVVSEGNPPLQVMDNIGGVELFLSCVGISTAEQGECYQYKYLKYTDQSAFDASGLSLDADNRMVLIYGGANEPSVSGASEDFVRFIPEEVDLNGSVTIPNSCIFSLLSPNGIEISDINGLSLAESEEYAQLMCNCSEGQASPIDCTVYTDIVYTSSVPLGPVPPDEKHMIIFETNDPDQPQPTAIDDAKIIVVCDCEDEESDLYSNYLCVNENISSVYPDFGVSDLDDLLPSLSDEAIAELASSFCNCSLEVSDGTQEPVTQTKTMGVYDGNSVPGSPGVNGQGMDLIINQCVDLCQSRGSEIISEINSSVSEYNQLQSDLHGPEYWTDMTRETLYGSDINCLRQIVIQGCVDQCQYDFSWVDETLIDNAGCVGGTADTYNSWLCYGDYVHNQMNAQAQALQAAMLDPLDIVPVLYDDVSGEYGYYAEPTRDYVYNHLPSYVNEMMDLVMNMRFGNNSYSVAMDDYISTGILLPSYSQTDLYRQETKDISYVTSDGTLYNLTLVATCIWEPGIDNTIVTDDEILQTSFSIFCEDLPDPVEILSWAYTWDAGFQYEVSVNGQLSFDQIARVYFDNLDKLHVMFEAGVTTAVTAPVVTQVMTSRDIVSFVIPAPSVAIPTDGNDELLIQAGFGDLYDVAYNSVSLSDFEEEVVVSWDDILNLYADYINEDGTVPDYQASYNEVSHELTVSLVSTYGSEGCENFEYELLGGLSTAFSSSQSGTCTPSTVLSFDALTQTCNSSIITRNASCPYGYIPVELGNNGGMNNPAVNTSFSIPMDESVAAEFIEDVEDFYMAAFGELMSLNSEMSLNQTSYGLALNSALSAMNYVGDIDQSFELIYYEYVVPFYVNGNEYDLSLTLALSKGLVVKESANCPIKDLVGVRMRLGCPGFEGQQLFDLMFFNGDGSHYYPFPYFTWVNPDCPSSNNLPESYDFSEVNSSLLFDDFSLGIEPNGTENDYYISLGFNGVYWTGIDADFFAVANQGFMLTSTGGSDVISDTTMNNFFIGQGDDGRPLTYCDENSNSLSPDGNCQACMAFVKAYEGGQDFNDVLPGGLPTVEFDCDEEGDVYYESVQEHFYYQDYLDQYRAILDSYQSSCPGEVDDHLVLTYEIASDHRTQYYYDRAGNLMSTVSPLYVKALGEDTYNELSSNRDTEPVGGSGFNPENYALDDDQANDILPLHHNDVNSEDFSSIYNYNSIGQKTWDITPDVGKTKYWYNAMGQLVLSQNAEQALHDDYPLYSYTRYDKLGRQVESGEMKVISSSVDLSELEDNSLKIPAVWNEISFPDNLVEENLVAKQEWTRTVYSDSYPRSLDPNYKQKNLRNRISYVYRKAEEDNNDNDYIYTVYSYDVHGNVDWIAQGIPGLGMNYVRYDYDLVSGNVNQVAFNEGTGAEFYHNYEYDSDNRILEVYTSTDGIIWDKDANYQYYSHGPLARTEIGQDMLQGIDYTYTLQGWLKTINHASLKTEDDPGKDGEYVSSVQVGEDLSVLGMLKLNGTKYPFSWQGSSEATASSLVAAIGNNGGLYAENNNGTSANIRIISNTAFNLEVSGSLLSILKHATYQYNTSYSSQKNNGFVEDEFGMELSYFENDYTRPGTNIGGDGTTEPALLSMGQSMLSLYDGNISAWAFNTRSGTGGEDSPFASIYRYDKLNRLRENNLYNKGVSGFALTGTSSSYFYDGNGNLSNLTRDENWVGFDKFVYKNEWFYPEGVDLIEDNKQYTNRLQRIVEPELNPVDPLVEGTHGDYVIATGENQDYLYDAIGNLTYDPAENLDITWTMDGKVKEVEDLDDGHIISYRYDAMGNRVVKEDYMQGADIVYTYYVRDAQGNIMATYSKEYDESSDRTEIELSEIPIYGSNRIGVYRANKLVASRHGEEYFDNSYYQLNGNSEHYPGNSATTELSLWRVSNKNEHFQLHGEKLFMTHTETSSTSLGNNLLAQVSLDPPNYTPVILDYPLHETTYKNVATAENVNGEAVFTVCHKKFRVLSHSTLTGAHFYNRYTMELRNHLGHFISYSSDVDPPLKGEYSGQSIVVRNPSNANTYFVVSGDIKSESDPESNKCIYYHKVNYQSSEDAEIVEANTILQDEDSNDLEFPAYPGQYALAVYNSTGDASKTRLYVAVYDTEEAVPAFETTDAVNKIRLYEFTVSDEGLSDGRLVHTFVGCLYWDGVDDGRIQNEFGESHAIYRRTNSLNLGEIQISPGGTRLGISMYRCGEHRIEWIELDSDLQTEYGGYLAISQEDSDFTTTYEPFDEKILSFDFLPGDESEKSVYLLQKENLGPAQMEMEIANKLKTTLVQQQVSEVYSSAPGCHNKRSMVLDRLPDNLNVYKVNLLYANMESSDITEIAEYEHCRDGNIRRTMDGSMIVNLQNKEQLYVYKGDFSEAPDESYKDLPEDNLLTNTGLPLQPHNVSHIVRSYTRVPGKKLYELTDHLGNVRVTFSDKKLPVTNSTDLTLDVVSRADYYPFGMPILSHTADPQQYRFGFQGQEKDNEWTGQEGSHLNYKYRVHDARIGRFLSIDPLTAKYPFYSPYAFSGNRVIDSYELEGLEPVGMHHTTALGFRFSGGVDAQLSFYDTYYRAEYEGVRRAFHTISEVGRGTANAGLMVVGIGQLIAGNASTGFSNNNPYPKWGIPVQLDGLWHWTPKTSWIDRTQLSTDDAIDVGFNTITILTLPWTSAKETIVTDFFVTAVPATITSEVINEIVDNGQQTNVGESVSHSNNNVESNESNLSRIQAKMRKLNMKIQRAQERGLESENRTVETPEKPLK